jgi:SAM-dependent methyltransferase
VDVVISNGVVTLTPDKLDTFREFRRILKPGGRLQIADVVVEKPLPDHSIDRLDLWTDCIAGATPVGVYTTLLREAGFIDAEVVEMLDVFSGTEIEARSGPYGACGAGVRASRP